MQRSVPLSPPPPYESPPPSYESVMQPILEPFVPPRYHAPSEGRNSIKYSQLPPLYDTTRLYLIDNKSADIATLNYQNDHSNYLTSVVQNSDYTPLEASTQNILLDDRSRWGGDLKTILHTNLPNITEFMFSNSFSVRVMTKRTDKGPEYDWFTLQIPEGNYSVLTTIDMMNNAIIENYLQVGRQNGVKEEDIGVKFDTRNFRLGFDPVTNLVMPGKYTYEGFHPDIVLLPGCAVDFTYSRLNNLLGIRKRWPYQEGFIISYDDLLGGNIPGLLDVKAYEDSLNDTTPAAPPRGDTYATPEKQPVIQALTKDAGNRSYHVGEDPEAPNKNFTAYRSWYLSYNYGNPDKGARATTLLCASDVTCGVEQVYWSMPDLAVEPVTFKASQDPSNYPVVGTELLPLMSRTFYNDQAVYSQMIRESTNQTHVFNRFPNNQILVRPPALTITCVSENVPTLTDHGVVPLKNSLSGVQRVTLTDARRRVCPYVYKSLGVVTPRVLSSKTF